MPVCLSCNDAHRVQDLGDVEVTQRPVEHVCLVLTSLRAQQSTWKRGVRTVSSSQRLETVSSSQRLETLQQSCDDCYARNAMQKTLCNKHTV